jgi:hypothetical protein
MSASKNLALSSLPRTSLKLADSSLGTIYLSIAILVIYGRDRSRRVIIMTRNIDNMKNNLYGLVKG